MTENAVAYLRVSTEDQDKGYGKTDQTNKIAELAARESIHIVATFEDSVGGGTYPRPGLTALLDFVAAQQDAPIQRMLIMCSDRLARDLFGRRRGWSGLFCDRPVELHHDPFGRRRNLARSPLRQRPFRRAQRLGGIRGFGQFQCRRRRAAVQFHRRRRLYRHL